MYEELVRRLRDSEHEIDCSLCDRDCCYPDGKVHGKCIVIEAADAIEELMRRCEQFQYMPPPAWIPVTERLPKADEYDARGYAVPYLVMNGWMRVTARRTKDYWVLFGEGTVLEYVTHWMPLPEPPKEE